MKGQLLEMERTYMAWLHDMAQTDKAKWPKPSNQSSTNSSTRHLAAFPGPTSLGTASTTEHNDTKNKHGWLKRGHTGTLAGGEELSSWRERIAAEDGDRRGPPRGAASVTGATGAVVAALALLGWAVEGAARTESPAAD